MTGGISATRQPPTHWICLSLPPRNKESLPPPPSVNLISRMMSLSRLWGQGLGDGQGDEFTAICLERPPPPPSLTAELGCPCSSFLSTAAGMGGVGMCGWGRFSVNVLIA